MILSFGDKYTEEIWGGTLVKGVPQAIQHVARRKLRMLNNSQNINDLRIPPSNHLEKLKGELKDYYSIRINDTWRIIFKWENSNSEFVKIINYR